MVARGLQAGAGDRNLICFVLCHDGSRWSGGGWAAAAGGENLDLFSNYARWKSRKIHPDEDAKHMVGNLFKENFETFEHTHGSAQMFVDFTCRARCLNFLKGRRKRISENI